MFAYKTLLLILTCVPFAHLRFNFRLARRPWSRRSHSDAYGDCNCNPNSNSYQLAKALDPNNYGIERLVIYVYRVLGDNNIKLVVPNAEKQINLHDPPIDSNDFVNTDVIECLQDIFQSSSERIRLNRPNLGAMQSHDTITLHPGFVHNSYNNNPSGETDTDASSKAEDEQQDIVYPNAEVLQDLDGLNQGQTLVSFSNNQILRPVGFSSSLVAEPESFSQWFDHQLKQFETTVPSDYDIVIQGDTFRDQVQNIIKSRGYLFLPDGGIVDETGRNIDLSKFELRPILVGSKIEHQRIFQYPSETLTIPKSHYLEGILVMFTDPSQILGMIPLRKSNLASPNTISSKLAVNNRNQYRQENIGRRGYSNTHAFLLKKLRNYVTLPSIERLMFAPKSLQAESAHINPKTKTSSKLFKGKFKLLPKKIVNSIISVSSDDVNSNNQGASIVNSASKITNSVSTDTVGSNIKLKDLTSNLKPDQRKILEYFQVFNRRQANAMPKETKESAKVKLPFLKNILSLLVDVLIPKTRRSGTVDDDFGNLDTKNTTKEAEGVTYKTKLETEAKNDTEHEAENTIVETQSIMKVDDSPNDKKIDAKVVTDETNDTKVETESDEPPGLRIIGGSAAMSSGIPLNNKGRSGYFSDFDYSY